MKQKISPLAGLITVLAAFALPARIKSLFGASLISAANDTYDAAVEVHDCAVRRTNDAAIAARHLLYKKGAGNNTIAVNGVGDIPLGTVDNIETATDMGQTVLLLGKGTTKKMVASEAIGAGARVFAAALGKVATSGTVLVGTALTAAAADDDVLEVQDIAPVVLASTEVVAATNTILASESGKTFFLASATEFVSTLPAPAAGLDFTFIVSAAPSGASYTIVTASGTDLIHGSAVSAADAGGSVDSTAGTAADTITFVDGQALKGDRVHLISDGTSWYADGICSDEDAITFTQS